METDPSLDARYLEIFPGFLRTLGEDAALLGEVIASDASEPVRRYTASALNYIFKSLDLIPDGIDDLGFLDDAFVLRVAAALALQDDAASASGGVLSRLRDEAKSVKDFLGDVYPRLESYVQNLRNGAARGRTVDDIVLDASTRLTFLREVTTWAADYRVPSFTRDVKTLIKLKAFLSAKLV